MEYLKTVLVRLAFSNAFCAAFLFSEAYKQVAAASRHQWNMNFGDQAFGTYNAINTLSISNAQGFFNSIYKDFPKKQ